MKQELKKKLGLVGRREMRDTDVLLLQVRNLNALRQKRSPGQPGSLSGSNDGGLGKLKCENQRLSTIAGVLEQMLNLPVEDQTGSNDDYSFEITWREGGVQDSTHSGLKQALLEQLGLALVPSRESTEMLVLDKAN